MLARIAGRLLLAAGLMGLAYGFLAFDDFPEPPARSIKGVAAGVVFTGAFERVDAGLRLLESGAVPRLFISGANGGSGVLPKTFLALFSKRNPNIKDLPRLLACCIEFGEAANDTLANATETRSWLRERHIEGPVLLITSRLHMARALSALSAALGKQKIIPYPVEDALANGDPLRQRVGEYMKYLATMVVARLPWRLDADSL